MFTFSARCSTPSTVLDRMASRSSGGLTGTTASISIVFQILPVSPSRRPPAKMAPLQKACLLLDYLYWHPLKWKRLPGGEPITDRQKRFTRRAWKWKRKLKQQVGTENGSVARMMISANPSVQRNASKGKFSSNPREFA